VNPSSLSVIKQSGLFADSPLLKQGRLSVVPLTQKQFEALVDGKL
jgi:predicted RNA-binding protein with PUA-like domain